ncbi:MAG TPA: hypothetical protein VG713_14785 [Pirellulales bacterium]|nr:hypothetical protein [Pirellulales bacterium]
MPTYTPSLVTPSIRTSVPAESHHDMTLKDWFAGQIIAAMLGSDGSSSSQRDENGQLCSFDKSRLANLAKNAYQVAEAMMQARAAVHV